MVRIPGSTSPENQPAYPMPPQGVPAPFTLKRGDTESDSLKFKPDFYPGKDAQKAINDMLDLYKQFKDLPKPLPPDKAITLGIALHNLYALMLKVKNATDSKGVNPNFNPKEYLQPFNWDKALGFTKYLMEEFGDRESDPNFDINCRAALTRALSELQIDH